MGFCEISMYEKSTYIWQRFSARWKTRGRGPGVRGTGSRGLENMGSGGKHGVSVENTGSKCKTQGNQCANNEVEFFLFQIAMKNNLRETRFLS